MLVALTGLALPVFAATSAESSLQALMSDGRVRRALETIRKDDARTFAPSVK